MTITTATYNNTPEKRENTQVTISKTVSTAASRYNIHTYRCIPYTTEYRNHIHKNTQSLSVCKCIGGD